MNFVKFPYSSQKSPESRSGPKLWLQCYGLLPGWARGGCWEGVVMVGVGWWWFVAVNGGLVGFSCWEWCFVLVCDVVSTVSIFYSIITVSLSSIMFTCLNVQSDWHFLGIKYCIGCFFHKVNQPCLTMAIYGYDCAPKQRRQVEYDPGEAFLRSVPWQL